MDTHSIENCKACSGNLEYAFVSYCARRPPSAIQQNPTPLCCGRFHPRFEHKAFCGCLYHVLY